MADTAVEQPALQENTTAAGSADTEKDPSASAPLSPPEHVASEAILPTPPPAEDENGSGEAPAEETYFIKGDRYQGLPSLVNFIWKRLLNFEYRTDA